MKNEQVRRILIIRLSSMGDIILTAPLIDLAAKTFPLARIDFCTKEKFSYLVKSNPKIHKVIKADNDLEYSSLKELRLLIKMSSYNMIIDAHNNLRSVYLRFLQDAEVLKLNKHSIKKFLLVNFKLNLLKNAKPIIERYKSIISGFASQADINNRSLPELLTNPVSERSIDKMLLNLNLSKDTKLVCIPAVSGHFTKTYPAEYFADIINRFPEENAAFFLTGRGNDSENIRKIKELTPVKKVYDLCDRLEIDDLISLIKRCSLVICGDTGPMHIAEAFNIPVFMAAGSSVKEFGFYPQNEKAVVLENNELKCRPCSHYGRAKCPKGHFKCMMEITPDNILSAISQLFNKGISS